MYAQLSMNHEKKPTIPKHLLTYLIHLGTGKFKVLKNCYNVLWVVGLIRFVNLSILSVTLAEV